MKRFLIIFPVVVVSLLIVTIPFIITAESCPNNRCEFENPLKAIDLPKLINSLVAQLTPLAITVVSLYIIIAGFRYITAVAGGQADSAKKAKELFVPALEFALIIAGGSVILKAVVAFVKQF